MTEVIEPFEQNQRPARTEPADRIEPSERVAQLDWGGLEDDLNAQGNATINRLLSPAQCAELAALYAQHERFRSRVVMARHGFGRGEYQYFNYPLPELVADLRAALYRRLAPIANRWQIAMNAAPRFPTDHAQYLEHCHAAGQRRPTPLLLSYGVDDYNCLHQDLYGEEVFPLQVIVLLSDPRRDFSGGELVMTEQRPRMQSRVQVVALEQGDAAIIAVHQRPARGSRGVYRVNMRHGVSRVRGGQRFTAGIIFHDAA